MSTANKMVNEEEVAAKSSEVLIYFFPPLGTRKSGAIRTELLQIINM